LVIAAMMAAASPVGVRANSRKECPDADTNAAHDGIGQRAHRQASPATVISPNSRRV
jgi:hypothetical protein